MATNRVTPLSAEGIMSSLGHSQPGLYHDRHVRKVLADTELKDVSDIPAVFVQLVAGYLAALVDESPQRKIEIGSSLFKTYRLAKQNSIEESALANVPVEFHDYFYTEKLVRSNRPS